jgi:hypothetical protein
MGAYVKHLNEGKCEQCLTLFPAAEQGTAHDEIFAGKQKLSEVPAAEGKNSASLSNDRSVDRWLFKEYFLIPQSERPMVGSNEWFRWLEEFQQRHPVKVSQLTRPLAKRACQVLWNSR